MRKVLFAILLVAPLASWAVTPCKFEAARNLQLDLDGVRGVQIDVHSRDLHLSGSDAGKNFSLTGKACASSQDVLDTLQVTQRREGDQLLIDLGSRSQTSFRLFGGRTYSSLDVTVQMPSNLPVTVRVGSGDADIRAMQQVRSIVGSGDLHVRDVPGKVVASVGSGDIDVSQVGSLDLGSVGSGDFNGDGIKGDVRIGSIGSGDVSLRRVGGSVHADTLGSGDLEVTDVGGDFSLGAKGSGDVNHAGVKGKLDIPRRD